MTPCSRSKRYWLPLVDWQSWPFVAPLAVFWCRFLGMVQVLGFTLRSVKAYPRDGLCHIVDGYWVGYLADMRSTVKIAVIEDAGRGLSKCETCGIRDLVLFADLEECDFKLINQLRKPL